MVGPVPWLPRPLDCVACNLCVLVCPVDALRLTDGSEGPALDLTL
jgi:formate hydrogenlyase subunit 6/NADH:ubiquinone oxidoreductase subunit I